MRLVYFLVVVLITGCASTVEHLSDISPDDGRECYSYRSHVDEENFRDASIRASSMLMFGGLAGGLVSIIATADPDGRAPFKCGLTLEDAINQAAEMAHFTESHTIWKQKRAGDWVMITVQPTEKHSDCWASTLLIEKAVNDWPVKKYTRDINTCKNSDGMPVIVKSDQ